MGWLRSLLGLGERTSGRPPSPNGASSFHVHWDVDKPLSSVAVTLEVVEPPVVESLYFFAMQASFWSNVHEGGAHAGLQWNPRHPGATAVNWGGYDSLGQVLDGSLSALPSAPADPNTRDFAWQPGVPYRIEIGPRTDDGWPATIAAPGQPPAVIRTLRCGGTELRSIMVWMEVFADCDAPPVAVRWSQLAATTLDGRPIAITAGRATYQSHRDGGCANTVALAEPGGFVQRSASERTTPHNASLRMEVS